MVDQIRGFAFPFCIDTESGSVASASGREKLRQNIAHLLLTAVGERVMRREYGAGLRQLVHDPNDDVLQALVRHRIVKSIGQFEPRVQLLDLSVAVDNATLWVGIEYLVRRTNERDGVSVPIFLKDV